MAEREREKEDAREREGEREEPSGADIWPITPVAGKKKEKEKDKKKGKTSSSSGTSAHTGHFQSVGFNRCSVVAWRRWSQLSFYRNSQ